MQELVQARVERLEAVFRDIAATRMVGVPSAAPRSAKCRRWALLQSLRAAARWGCL
ncbi:MAG: hypothetical protein V9G23_12860 [Giesbergeria sp.]